MNMFINNKKNKKFILILVLLILFSFMYPKQVQAFDFVGNISSFFFWIERSVIGYINDIFCDEGHSFRFSQGEAEICFTPENIMKGKFILFDADIFKDISSYGPQDRYDQFDWLVGDKSSGEEGARVTLRNSIAGWYFNLVNFAVVGLLSVLVYVGIRMITSTISQDKAKYKAMFKDWVVAICLLVSMHYIMIATLHITTLITESMGSSGGADQTAHLMSIIYNINKNDDVDDDDKCDYGVEGCRYCKEMGADKCYTIGDAFTYELLLLAIILLTFLFAWKYLKREFTVIFLILIGPISCITYPIDKISDGKAQAFNKWLSEFVYNVLVQPFHLLIYIVLVGTAVDLASENILYGLAALAMIIPAEKFIKEMFGFKDKLGSPLGAMATGAAASQMFNKMKGGASGKSGKDQEITQGNLPKNKINEKDLGISGEKTAVGEEKTKLGGNEHLELGEGESPPVGDGANELPEVNNEAIEDDGDDTGNANGASVAAAYQDSSDPARDAKREALEEKMAEGLINEEDLTDDEKILLGDSALEDYYNSGFDKNASGEYFNPYTDEYDSTYDPHKDFGKKEEPAQEEPLQEQLTQEEPAQEQSAQEQPVQEQSKKDIKSKPRGAIGKLVDRHSARMAKKWKSTDRKQRWKNRGIALAKGAIKGAGALTGAAVGASVGLLSGKGIAAGAVAGAKLTGKAMDKVSSVGGEYLDALRTPEQRENKALNEFRGDANQQDKARLNFMENHDGREPSSKELDNEMKDRFELSRAGLSDTQIDGAVAEYQKLKASGMTQKEALAESVFSARYGDMYKGKFSKPKDMQEAVSGLERRLIDNGYEGNAQLKATEILQRAANMKKEDFALKLPDKTITLNSPANSDTQQQVEINVQEGAVNVKTNRNTNSINKIDVKMNFKENMDNKNILAEKDSSESNVMINNVDTTNVQNQISATKNERMRNINSNKKDLNNQRIEGVKEQEAIDNNLDVKASKKKIQESEKRQLGSAD